MEEVGKSIVSIRRKNQINLPADNYRRMEQLLAEMEKLRPYRKPQNRMYRFDTWEALEKFTIRRASEKL